MEIVNTRKQGYVTIDGQKYVSVKAACELTGFTRRGLDKKINSLGIKKHSYGVRRVLFRLDDIEKAIREGRFAKYL